MPFAWLYGKIIDFRNKLYDRGIFRSHSLGAKTVSIGNITAGGTGKTPLVALLAEILAESGEKVCILTRGYGRADEKQRVLVSDGETIFTDARTAGDEPLLLAQKLLGKAIVIADADRISAAEWAKEKFGVTAFVLDDAFQHRRVKRDLDIICIDATNPFGNRASFLREPLHNLKRADAIVVTRADLVLSSGSSLSCDEAGLKRELKTRSQGIQDLKSEILKWNSAAPIFISENKLSEVIDLESFHAKTQGPQSEIRELKSLDSQLGLAFCGIGNPKSFFEQLRREGFQLIDEQAFRDHYFYTQSDVNLLEKKAEEMEAEILLTTAKDAVKLRNLKFEIPCFVVESEMKFEDENGFRREIQRFLSGGPLRSPQ